MFDYKVHEGGFRFTTFGYSQAEIDAHLSYNVFQTFIQDLDYTFITSAEMHSHLLVRTRPLYILQENLPSKRESPAQTVWRYRA